ncbi:MAG: hypothetical protein J7M24_07730, partial [Candidatus Latescibacteria bacterium]|nr:hypothetical protein [Candidatus Latescibacterota bacterium]
MNRMVAVIGALCFLVGGMSFAQSPDGNELPKIPAFGKIQTIRSVPSSEKPAAPLELRVGERITATGSLKYGLDWSPDGEWIAYEDQGDIWLISSAGQSGGAEPFNLTESIEEYCLDPSFAPDNSGVLFSKWNSTTSEITVDFVDLTGAVQQVLVNGAVAGVMSGDGRYLAYLVAASSDLAVYDYTTGSNKVIAKGDNDFGRLCFLPDNTTIVFSKLVGDVSRLFTVPATGGDPIQLTTAPGDHDYPDASPLGDWVMYTDWNLNFLFAYNMNTDQTVRVKKDLKLNHILGRFSPDGSRYAYVLFNADETGSDVFISEFPFAGGGGEESSITLTSPNGFESWEASTSHNITWTFSGVDNIKLEYSTNNGTDWTEIVASTAASAGSYAWTVPASTSTSVLVRVSDTSNASLNDQSDAEFTIIAGELIAYYPFNGNANDETGKGHTGTVTGAQLTTDKDGNSNSAYSFDGDSDIIEIADASDLHITSEITISAWVKPDNIEGEKVIVWKDDHSDDSINGPSKDCYGLHLTTDGNLRFYFGPNSHIASSNCNIQIGVWTHVAATFNDSNDELVFYINGQLKQTINTGNTINDASDPIAIGAFRTRDGGIGACFIGYIDELRIYNYALSAGEIAAIGTPADYVTLTSPNGSESWEASSSHNITWTSSGVTSLLIEYSTDGGSSWNLIAENVPASDGEYRWTVSDNASESCLVRITGKTDTAAPLT